MGTNSLAVDAVILAGPTASGKTELLDAMFGTGSQLWLPRLREAWNVDIAHAHIISADSMQAYRGMDIGTAKPSLELRERLPHSLIDIKKPDEQYTVGEFVLRADSLCAELCQKGVLPIISGGTGFYLMNYLCGLPSAPASSAIMRAVVAHDLAKYGPSVLRQELSSADPELAQKIKENDLYRLTRAIEILRSTGKPPSFFAPAKAIRHGKKFLVLGILRPRELIRERIRNRVNAMMMEGLADEVQSLIARGYGPSDPGMKAIGYKEFFALKSSSLKEITDAIVLHSSQYAKRQMTYFRSLPGIKWIEPREESLFGALANASLI